MSLLNNIFQRIESRHRRFFDDDFFGFADLYNVDSPFSSDPFFRKPLDSPMFVFRKDPFQEAVKVKEVEEVTVRDIESDSSDSCDSDEEEEVEKKKKKKKKKKPKSFSKYFFQTTNKSVVNGKKKETSTRREGSSRSGKEVYSVRKRIGDKHFTVIRKKGKDGLEKITSKVEKIKPKEEKDFLNLWTDFFFGSDFKPKVLKEEKPLESPQMVKAEEKRKKKEAKKEKELKEKLSKMKEEEKTKYLAKLKKKKEKKERKKEEKAAEKKRKAGKRKLKREKKQKKKVVKKDKPSVFYSCSRKECNINGVKQLLKTERVRKQDGSEAYTVSKRIGDQKIKVKLNKDKDGKETTKVERKNLEEKDEKEFLKNFDNFASIQEAKIKKLEEAPKKEEKKLELEDPDKEEVKKEEKEETIEITEKKE